MPHFRFHRTTDGAQLAFEQRGGGPGAPVLLLDGIGCDGFIWRYLWAPLSEGRSVIHVHYRGHGQSTLGADPRRLGVEVFAEDAASLLDTLGVESAVVLGHSLGVQVALELHRRSPARVSGLGLICGSTGHPLDTWHGHSLLRLALPSVLAVVQRVPRLARWAAARILRTELALELGIRTELNPQLIQRSDFFPYMEHMARMDPLTFLRTLEAAQEHSAMDHLEHVQVPSLVLGGELDRFTPAWLSERMAELLPRAEYWPLAGASHTAPLERPAQTAEAVLRLLRRVEAAGRARGDPPG